jgi:hypothetical protein
MAYNVFKRPMFKRGGTPAQGSGIMSHVEPRVQAKDGYDFTKTPVYKGASGLVNYGPNAAMAGILDFVNVPLNTLARGFGYNPGFSGTKQMDLLTGGAFSKQTGYDPETAYFMGVPTSAKTGFSKEVKPQTVDDFEVGGSMGQGDVATRLPGETAMDAVMRQGKERAAERAAKATVIKDTEGNKDNKYKESDARGAIQKEADLIKDLLSDKGLDKAELAFLIAKAAKTGGNISDKLEVANDEAIKLAAAKRKKDREATLLAYKGYKDTEAAKIKAGEPTGTQKTVKEFAALSEKVNAGTASKAEQAVFNAYKSGVFKDDSDSTVKALAIQFAKNPEVLTDLESSIRKLSAKKDRSEREEQKLQVDAQNYSRIQNIIKAGGLGEYFNFKQGGRVMKQMGGDVIDEVKTESELELGVKETPGDSNVFPTKTVEKLSFQELRDRLPQEITNDIVQLLSNSQEALQEFAYIRSQQDINDFNLKYGVNLILPPQKG